MTISRFRLGIATAAVALAPATALAQQLMPAPTPNADALAAQMRILGENPRDVPALLRASELSIRLSDTPAALSFLARAQAVDPSNPRILAGRASALVSMERPAEALRLYGQAERAGVAMTPYLSQRGLAYDLTGQPTLAQQDYRRVLAAGADDEVTRRLALSLGISGRRDEALALLDPLLRRNDRASWRAWSFVLAMVNDQAEARKIVSGMMVGGAAMAPFLERLPALGAADRAFAVHFGQLSPSPARLADARMAPGSGAQVGTLVASRAPAMSAPRPVPARMPTPAPAPTTVAPAPTPTPAPVRVASGTPIPVPSSLTGSPAPNVVRSASTYVPSAPIATAAPTPPPSGSLPATGATLPPVRPTPAPVTQPVAPVRTPDVARRNTQLLASIIETINVPATEREVAPPKPVVARPVKVALAKPKPVVEPKTVDTKKTAVDKKADAKLSADAKTTDSKAKKLADAKADTDAKGKKAADAKKVADTKKPDPAKGEAQRWWVQVAGGANEDDLGKDWKRVTAKSSALKGKGAYTTPLRATNRLLTGPFKSQEEAMALVNTLKKDGTSAFAWQSPAGQKVTRLPAK
ncbi:tetratricopeptide repeat protein [Sphingomonas floccifaciens]|uniref:Tetratricopeptide repeat protein n=1 Tax=Sphingomonas floccifaciens TaxID=1844115 RepID=A0ABW4NKD9_9SPHN